MKQRAHHPRQTTVASPPSFAGFSQGTFRFFRELESNNTKAWFSEHRNDYDEHVAEPMKALARTLLPTMREIDGLFETRETRILSRPHRDTRFSKDRSPYHTAAWLLFRRPGKDWVTAPAYYFETSARRIRYGMGFYQAAPKTMQRLRASIDEDPGHFRAVFSKIEKASHLRLEGEAYARHIINPHEDWFQRYYQKRNLYFLCEEKTAFAVKGEMAHRLLDDFRLLAPAYRYMIERAC